ncbi:hypothetical protein C7435_1593 [Maricaulis maris]|uniref:Uncharacterized protein n=1 Tax=Maricaulis maris TaxID=74318 RepID=A0A495DEQ6_9PROT|nr:hypothetical protein C7435_1593 [Maricaulis maris]
MNCKPWSKHLPAEIGDTHDFHNRECVSHCHPRFQLRFGIEPRSSPLMGEADRPAEREGARNGRPATERCAFHPFRPFGAPSPSRGRTGWRHSRSSHHTLNLRHPAGTAQRASGGPRLAAWSPGRTGGGKTTGRVAGVPRIAAMPRPGDDGGRWCGGSSPLMGEVAGRVSGQTEWVMGGGCRNAARFTPSAPSGHLPHQGEGPGGGIPAPRFTPSISVIPRGPRSGHPGDLGSSVDHPGVLAEA